MKKTLLFILLCLPVFLKAQITISIDVTAGKKTISPYLFGLNSSLLSGFSTPLSGAQWLRYKDARVQIVRAGGGNNSTKYNWRNKLCSHPDWYNNVYEDNWNTKIQLMQTKLPDAQSLFSFQLIGKSPKTSSQNFNDYNYNGSAWWTGCAQNLAGGGTVNTVSGTDLTKALVEGDTSKYLMNWPADSTVGILNYWFGETGLKLNKTKALYWEMDNEPEIWSGTHDDVYPTQPSAEEFMQKYFAVAKAARALYPEIKLCGPVMANEWQWYNYSSGITYNNKKYNWSEYFIMRIAQEQAASGIRLLDVFNVHFYPGETTVANMLQTHRVFFDKAYDYPGANGVKNITGSWNSSITKEYYFSRVQAWLDTYLGTGNGVGLGVSEMDINSSSASVNACWYASMLGEFMKNGVEIFTPWTWKLGMWETLHLFNRYRKQTYVQATSSSDAVVSAYPSINAAEDSLTVFLVNRSESVTQSTTLNFSNFAPTADAIAVLTLKSLSNTIESFASDTSNALIASTATASNGSVTVSLAPLSVTALLIKKAGTNSIEPISNTSEAFDIYPNPMHERDLLILNSKVNTVAQLQITDMCGRTIANKTIQLTIGKNSLNSNVNLHAGIYSLKISSVRYQLCKKIVVCD